VIGAAGWNRVEAATIVAIDCYCSSFRTQIFEQQTILSKIELTTQVTKARQPELTGELPQAGSAQTKEVALHIQDFSQS
jgi:hypothetical protein